MFLEPWDLCTSLGILVQWMHHYSQTCHLRSLFWTATYHVRPLYEVYLFYNSLHCTSSKPCSGELLFKIDLSLEQPHTPFEVIFEKGIPDWRAAIRYGNNGYGRKPIWTNVIFLNIIDVILPLLCKDTCLLQPSSAKENSGLTKQLYCTYYLLL